MRNLVALWGVALSAGLAGCSGGLGIGRHDPRFIKPTIAVMKFENRAMLPLGWDLGEGMKDILVDRLVATRRFHVIERPELELIMKELRFQQTGATRTHNRARLGRIKNVQYLVKGTVTDFGHVASGSGFLRWADRLALLGGGNLAVMSMTLYVVDVESGEIVSSESLQESVSAKDLNVKAAYKDVTFGGQIFHKTPLGRVTAKVMDKAVRRVAKTVAARPWQPKIAQVGPRSVVINGGRNRGVEVGQEYDVLELGAPIIDPDTGDVIGTSAGRVVGRLRVAEVHPRYSVAQAAFGRTLDMQIGQRCRPAEGPPPARPAEADRAPAVSRDGVTVTIGGDLTTGITAAP
jgi:curli biogenesis system outer membrane secretion channel CsgG